MVYNSFKNQKFLNFSCSSVYFIYFPKQEFEGDFFMNPHSFHMFSDTRFLDLTAYQYGSEQQAAVLLRPRHTKPLPLSLCSFRTGHSRSQLKKRRKSGLLSGPGRTGLSHRARLHHYLLCRWQQPVGIRVGRIRRASRRRIFRGSRPFCRLSDFFAGLR